MESQIKIKFQSLEIPFIVAFKHASFTRSESASVWVEIDRNGKIGYGEGCPRPYVTNETVTSALDWMSSKKLELSEGCTDFNSLKSWISANKSEIDKHPSAWCALELAFLDLFAKENEQSVEQLLGLNDSIGAYRYTAVVGDGDKDKVEKLFEMYRKIGFKDFKLKLSGDFENDSMKLNTFKQRIAANIEKASLRVDANNLWDGRPQEAIDYLHMLNFPFLGIEEPLGSRQYDDLKQLSTTLNTPIILDESLCNRQDLQKLERYNGQWIGNVRVSKMGGILRSLDVVRELKAMNTRIIVGAQVGETSLLTRAALIVANAAEDHLIGQEGAFGTHLLKFDPIEPLLMFGKEGILRMGTSENETGFGMKKTR